MPEYDAQHGGTFVKELDFFQSRDQNLIFLHKKTPDLNVGVLDEALPDRCFMIQMSANINGGTHPAKKLKLDEARNAVVPSSRTVQLLNLFEEIQTRGDFANFAMCPVFRDSVTPSDGISQLLGPINSNNLIRHLNVVMELVDEARRAAGIDDFDGARLAVLQSSQFDKAYTWLRNTFETQFMDNQELKADKKRRRNAFKAWKFSLLRNVLLLRTLIQHGMQEPKKMSSLC